MNPSQAATRLSETEAERDLGEDDGESTRLVPVVESIRYRKRAQSAEKRAEELAEQLDAAHQKVAAMSEQLAGLEVEQTLTRKLVAAGAVDLETAVLIAKTRLGADGDVDRCVEQLKNDKQYLFGSPSADTSKMPKTAGARDRAANGTAALERAAKKAARTGNRVDLQEYLRLRRSAM